ncbi:MAG: class I SAM-dependent rRNA methyltransferase [Paludibacteraceae bacterium]|nr:class I SAM-dependent rRNA methyltransferase [Paludibacteraceae bacterium]
MTDIVLKKKKEESLLRFHPWVFSGAIQKVVLDAHGSTSVPEEGSVVAVRSCDGALLGVGHWQIGSIAVRILVFSNDETLLQTFVAGVPDSFFIERLKRAYQVRIDAGLVREDNTAYRLVHGEGDFLPGLVVDIYGATAVVQAHSVGMHQCVDAISRALLKVVAGLKNVYYKSSATLPFKAPVPVMEREDRYIIYNGKPAVTQPSVTDEDCIAVENGLRFGIDWLQGQKTGFFLDQRDNRALVEYYSKGKSVLNMFCYTGGFSVYALRGGALEVDSVDVSDKAVRIAERNVLLNFPDCKAHHAYAEEAFRFFANPPAAEGGKEKKYDLVILDPPAFAKHRDAVKNALQGYKRINAKAFEKIKSGGVLFTFSCSQAIDKEMFRLAVFSAAAMSGRRVRILHQLHQPADHPINIYHPEGEYLKGLVLYVE